MTSLRFMLLHFFVLFALILNISVASTNSTAAVKEKNRDRPSITVQLSKPSSAEQDEFQQLMNLPVARIRNSGLSVCTKACENNGMAGGHLLGDQCFCNCVPNPYDSNAGVDCSPTGPGANVNCNQVCQIFGLGGVGYCSDSEGRCVCTGCPYCPCQST